jgi:hypothetical protein
MEQYVTVKNPDSTYSQANSGTAAWDAATDAQTGIKGDDSANDVANFRANITSSVSNYDSLLQFSTPANPPQQLLVSGFIVPQIMKFVKTYDAPGQGTANPNYDANLAGSFLSGTGGFISNFDPANPGSVTTGNTAVYGGAGGVTYTDGTLSGQVLADGNIPITSSNYLFGNFNQLGTRDLSALETAQEAQAVLYAAPRSGSGRSRRTCRRTC